MKTRVLYSSFVAIFVLLLAFLNRHADADPTLTTECEGWCPAPASPSNSSPRIEVPDAYNAGISSIQLRKGEAQGFIDAAINVQKQRVDSSKKAPTTVATEVSAHEKLVTETEGTLRELLQSSDAGVLFQDQNASAMWKDDPFANGSTFNGTATREAFRSSANDPLSEMRRIHSATKNLSADELMVTIANQPETALVEGVKLATDAVKFPVNLIASAGVDAVNHLKCITDPLGGMPCAQKRGLQDWWGKVVWGNQENYRASELAVEMAAMLPIPFGKVIASTVKPILREAPAVFGLVDGYIRNGLKRLEDGVASSNFLPEARKTVLDESSHVSASLIKASNAATALARRMEVVVDKAAANGVVITDEKQLKELARASEMFEDGFAVKNAEDANKRYRERFKEPPYSEGAIIEGTLAADTAFYRITGGTSEPEGSWLIDFNPRNSDLTKNQIRELVALPDENEMSFVSEVRIKAGTRLYFGGIRENFKHPGGGTQWEVPYDGALRETIDWGTPIPW